MEKNYGNFGLRDLPVTQYLLNKYLFVEYIEWMYMNESWLFNIFGSFLYPSWNFVCYFSHLLFIF